MPDLHSLTVDIARLCAWLVLLSVVFVPLERAFALPHGGQRGRLGIDLGYYFLNSLAPSAFLALPLAAMAALSRAALPEAYAAGVGSLPLWSKILAALIVGELGAYWGHRWTHASPFLWRFHKIHHAPERLHFLVNTHGHPIDMIFARLCALTPLYALGLADPGLDRTAIVPILVTLIGTMWTFFIHADLRWRFGPLEWVVATPAFHHWHHTNDAHRDRNFASLLPVIDRLFGTAHLPAHWPPCYGIDHEKAVEKIDRTTPNAS